MFKKLSALGLILLAFACSKHPEDSSGNFSAENNPAPKSLDNRKASNTPTTNTSNSPSPLSAPQSSIRLDFPTPFLKTPIPAGAATPGPTAANWSIGSARMAPS